MDLAQATGQPEEITLECGATIAVRPLKLREWGGLQAWFKRTCPSPVARAAQALQQLRDDGSDVDDGVEERLLDHAQRAALNWPPRVGSLPWFDALTKADGAVAQFLATVVALADPAFTPERAEALASRLTALDMREVLRVALHGGHPDVPKG